MAGPLAGIRILEIGHMFWFAVFCGLIGLAALAWHSTEPQQA